MWASPRRSAWCCSQFRWSWSSPITVFSAWSPASAICSEAADDRRPILISPWPLLLPGPQCRGSCFPAGPDRHRFRVRRQSDTLYPVSAGWRFVALVPKILLLARFHERLAAKPRGRGDDDYRRDAVRRQCRARLGTRRSPRYARHHGDHAVPADAAGDPDRPGSVPNLCLAGCRPAALGAVLGHTLVSIPYV